MDKLDTSIISSNSMNEVNNCMNILIRDIGSDSNYLCMVPSIDEDHISSDSLMRSPLISLLDQQSNILSSSSINNRMVIINNNHSPVKSEVASSFSSLLSPTITRSQVKTIFSSDQNTRISNIDGKLIVVNQHSKVLKAEMIVANKMKERLLKYYFSIMNDLVRGNKQLLKKRIKKSNDDNNSSTPINNDIHKIKTTSIVKNNKHLIKKKTTSSPVSLSPKTTSTLPLPSGPLHLSYEKISPPKSSTIKHPIQGPHEIASTSPKRSIDSIISTGITGSQQKECTEQSILQLHSPSDSSKNITHSNHSCDYTHMDTIDIQTPANISTKRRVLKIFTPITRYRSHPYNKSPKKLGSQSEDTQLIPIIPTSSDRLENSNSDVSNNPSGKLQSISPPPPPPPPPPSLLPPSSLQPLATTALSSSEMIILLQSSGTVIPASQLLGRKRTAPLKTIVYSNSKDCNDDIISSQITLSPTEEKPTKLQTLLSNLKQLSPPRNFFQSINPDDDVIKPITTPGQVVHSSSYVDDDDNGNVTDDDVEKGIASQSLNKKRLLIGRNTFLSPILNSWRMMKERNSPCTIYKSDSDSSFLEISSHMNENHNSLNMNENHNSLIQNKSMEQIEDLILAYNKFIHKLSIFYHNSIISRNHLNKAKIFLLKRMYEIGIKALILNCIHHKESLSSSSDKKAIHMKYIKQPFKHLQNNLIEANISFENKNNLALIEKEITIEEGIKSTQDIFLNPSKDINYDVPLKDMKALLIQDPITNESKQLEVQNTISSCDSQAIAMPIFTQNQEDRHTTTEKDIDPYPEVSTRAQCVIVNEDVPSDINQDQLYPIITGHTQVSNEIVDPIIILSSNDNNDFNIPQQIASYTVLDSLSSDITSRQVSVLNQDTITDDIPKRKALALHQDVSPENIITDVSIQQEKDVIPISSIDILNTQKLKSLNSDEQSKRIISEALANDIINKDGVTINNHIDVDDNESLLSSDGFLTYSPDNSIDNRFENNNIDISHISSYHNIDPQQHQNILDVYNNNTTNTHDAYKENLQQEESLSIVIINNNTDIKKIDTKQYLFYQGNDPISKYGIQFYMKRYFSYGMFSLQKWVEHKQILRHLDLIVERYVYLKALYIGMNKLKKYRENNFSKKYNISKLKLTK